MYKIPGRLLVLSIALSVCSHSLAWNPRDGWRDSYAVDGICYCDSSNFDHGIGDKKVKTPDGHWRSVRQICADITARYGVGSESGRIPYNTIACGHAPANDAPDEDLISGCPGRVDQGKSGCFETGPLWPLESLYGQPIPQLDRSRWKLTSSHNQRATSALADGDTATRWTTNEVQKPGQWLSVDFGKHQLINSVEIDTVESRHDYPSAWKLEASVDGHHWRVIVDSQSGTTPTGEITRIQFPPVTTQYIRVTQTGHSASYYWSIHELYVGYADRATDKY